MSPSDTSSSENAFPESGVDSTSRARSSTDSIADATFPGSRSTDSIPAALSCLERWIEAEDFRGWDPYDALRSPILRRLTFGSRIVGIFWVQLLKHSPVNLRPLFRVPPGRNPKGMGLFLSSYLRRYRRTGDPADLARVRRFARWLEDDATSEYDGLGWGYDFDWPNRGFFAPAGTPTVVNTAFNGLALLETTGLEGVFGDPERGLELARKACEFVLGSLATLEPAPDELCFSYTPIDRRFIHNANVLAAQLLAEVAGREAAAAAGSGADAGALDSSGSGGDAHRFADVALRACRYTVRRQRPDGSWPYGEGRTEGWVDNFHTGFVLVGLRRVSRALGTAEFDDAIARGYAFWSVRMFREDGAPKYYPDRTYPLDAHAVAQAILTFLEFRDADPAALSRAEKAARWAIEAMQDPRGYFHFQIRRFYRIRIPYMRWSQAWMQRALAELVDVEQDIKGQEGS